ncbi:MAG: 3-deoxy-D-manno-octulosonic acid transferase [Fibrobacteria bacterium]|jgi:3-deoxy-D-manno-octulosonic-acid transferase|nr:3-deoxy-D-manno-octulosonic acid transferase [Fibrobacteria bacterium]
MRFSLLLALYRLAWEPALMAARALASLEKASGRDLWPRRWRLAERLEADGNPGNTVSNTNVTLWMHAASLGESKGLWAAARFLAEDRPDRSFVLTTNTVEGLDFLRARVRAAGAPARWSVALAPLDHPRVVRKFLDRHGVRALVLFEGELWPHFVGETKRAGKPVLWISALAPRAPRILRPVLQGLDWTLAQTEAGAARIRRAGARAVETGADLRGLHYLGERPQRAPEIPDARAGIALVSLHADELRAILPALAGPLGNIPLFVFPRKLDSLPAFRAALEPLGFTLRSADSRAARQIVDAFGLVGETLDRCRAAVIGGSFAPHGGHNLWEPLAAGVSMAIGPWHAGQDYLVKKLAAAGLLKICPHAPDLAALHARPDSRTACRQFVETEERSLRAGLETLRTRLDRLLA